MQHNHNRVTLTALTFDLAVVTLTYKILSRAISQKPKGGGS